MKKNAENHVKVTSCVAEAITAMASKKISYHVSKMLDGNCVVNDHTDKATSIDGIAMLDSGDTVALFKGGQQPAHVHMVCGFHPEYPRKKPDRHNPGLQR